MKTDNRKTFPFKVNAKSYYLTTLIAFMTVAAVIFFIGSNFNKAAAAAAQESDKEASYKLTPEMLSYALNYKSEDLNVRYEIMNQLPCTELASSELGGRTLKPGVYCLSSANLEGSLVLDGAMPSNHRRQPDLSKSVKLNQPVQTDSAAERLTSRSPTVQAIRI